MALQNAASLALGDDQIAIGITHGALGTHLGVAYLDEKDVPKLLHLAFHKRLHIDSFPPQSPWGVSLVKLGPLSASQARALLCGMAEKYAGGYKEDSVHYGINLLAGVDSIQSGGQYTPTEDCDGFTCASIVAAVMSRIGFPLVAIDTWEPREINRAWGRAILCMLRALDTPVEHVALVEKHNAGLRLRPEEVVAASEVEQARRPVKYSTIRSRADDVFKEMLAICGSPPSEQGVFTPCATAYDVECKAIAISELKNCIHHLIGQRKPE